MHITERLDIGLNGNMGAAQVREAIEFNGPDSNPNGWLEWGTREKALSYKTGRDGWISRLDSNVLISNIFSIQLVLKEGNKNKK
jgi:hypothetical protein